MKRNPELYWHCLQCGAHDPVEPTGGTEQEQYGLGDHEPCITCGSGTAYVVTLRMGACYEQGRALGMDIRDAWDRALRLRGGK
jgi:hypothetical protein